MVVQKQNSKHTMHIIMYVRTCVHILLCLLASNNSGVVANDMQNENLNTAITEVDYKQLQPVICVYIQLLTQVLLTIHSMIT